MITQPSDEDEPERTNSNGHVSEGSKKSAFLIFGKKIAKSPIVFVVQTLIILIVIVASVVNLSINSHDDPNSKLWISLLSGCVGTYLPNPSIKFSKD